MSDYARTLPVTINLPLYFVHAVTTAYEGAKRVRHPAAHDANDFLVYVMARGLTVVEDET